MYLKGAGSVAQFSNYASSPPLPWQIQRWRGSTLKHTTSRLPKQRVEASSMLCGRESQSWGAGTASFMYWHFEKSSITFLCLWTSPLFFPTRYLWLVLTGRLNKTTGSVYSQSGKTAGRCAQSLHWSKWCPQLWRNKSVSIHKTVSKKALFPN